MGKRRRISRLFDSPRTRPYHRRDMKPIATSCVCPICGETVPAVLEERAGDMWLRRECPRDGVSESPFWRDAALYKSTYGLRHSELLPEGPLDLAHGAADGFLTTFAVDVTTRCNLACPTCVTDAGAAATPDPTPAEILSWVPDYSKRPGGFRPNISLVGGESTLREDLPEIVRGLLAKGIVPRLNTNGMLLLDEARVERLWQAGLRWVILQFDGFSPQTSLLFRGRDLIADKRRVIDLLTRKGFTIHLAVMVQRGVNDGEVGEILRFAAATPGIARVSFYPRSRLGRFADEKREATDAADVIDAIERTTGGEVTRRDILDAKRVGRALFRLTGHPMFRQRVCIFPFLLLRRGERLLPVSRLFSPAGLLSDPVAAVKMAWLARQILRPDQSGFGDELLFVNIEKFYDREAFDLRETRNCHHVYLSSKGAYPFCVYNAFHRDHVSCESGR